MNMTGGVICMVSGFLYDFIKLFITPKIFVNGFFKRKGSKILHNNWGDDINISMFCDNTDLTILPRNVSKLYKILPVKNYICIGSVLGFYDNRRMEVWGSGLISDKIQVKLPIGKIWSVRGPLTRKRLLEQGIDCPMAFGDPALLVSRFYRPSVVKKYKIGIIPHYKDADNDAIRKFAEGRSDVKVISMSSYDNWREIPDIVYSCECVISSSLHGLIVADSYQIPNVWVQFSDKLIGGTFKFLDYFSSVGRTTTKPFEVNSELDLVRIEEANCFENEAMIDYESIINSCPFKEHLKL